MMSQNEHRILTLKHPIDYGDTVVTELKIMEPMGRHLKNMDLMAINQLQMPAVAEALADLSGQPSEVIDRLKGADFMAGCAMVIDFLKGMSEPLIEPSAS